MRKLSRTALAVGMLVATAGIAFAQQPTADDHAAQNPAMKSPNHMMHARLAKGHNSFTSGEARYRFEKAGYQHVSGLTLDSDGLWQAQATRHGRSVHVALDYKGNVDVL